MSRVSQSGSEATKAAILREVENESFCFLSLGTSNYGRGQQSSGRNNRRGSSSMRTHPFNHAIRDYWDRPTTVSKMSSWMSSTIDHRRDDTIGCSASMYLSEAACEKSVAKVIDRNVDALAAWVDECRENHPSEKVQRISFTTRGQLSSSGSYNTDMRAASHVADMLHRFTWDELREIPDDSCCFVVNPMESEIDDGSVRQPVKASVVRCEEQSLTLQFDPDSPCGFVVVTAYPIARSASRRTPESFYNGNVYSEMMLDAYLQTTDGKASGVSSSYDTLSVMAGMTPNVAIYHNEKRYVAGELREGVNLVFGTSGNYEGRFFVDESSIMELVTDRYGKQKGAKVSSDNELLAPFKSYLDGMFGSSEGRQFWPSPVDPAGSLHGRAVSELLDDVREHNRNSLTGRYAPGNLAIYSQGDPVTLVMSSRDSYERYAVVVDGDEVLIKPSVQSDEQVVLTYEMLAQGGETSFAQELVKFRQSLESIKNSNSSVDFPNAVSCSLDDLSHSFYEMNANYTERLEEQRAAILALRDRPLSERLNMVAQLEENHEEDTFGDFG